MSKCPNCGAELTSLRNFTLHWSEYRFELDKDGAPSYVSDQIILYEPQKSEYVCPECDKTLFKKESKAIAFLKGE